VITIDDRAVSIGFDHCYLYTAITIDDSTVGIGFAGDNAVVTLTGIDATNLSIGNISNVYVEVKLRSWLFGHGVWLVGWCACVCVWVCVYWVAGFVHRCLYT
jgi:hypothetical protein